MTKICLSGSVPALRQPVGQPVNDHGPVMMRPWSPTCAERRVRNGHAFEPLVQLPHEGLEVDFQGQQPGPEFEDVQPALTPLDLADRALSLPEADSEVGLTKATCLAAAAQHDQKDFVVPGVERLEHGGLSWATVAALGAYSESESKAEHRGWLHASKLALGLGYLRMNGF